jgi:zinc ribbon protein
VPAPRAKCPNCGEPHARRAKFCPECGTRLAGGKSDTATALLEEAPPAETGPVPVNVTSAAPRLFGVTPPLLVFVLGVAALTIAIVLLIAGEWLPALLSLAAALLLFAAFAEVARRKPGGAVVRASAGALGAVRARAGFAVDSIATRSRAGREIARARRELLELGWARERLIRDLGEAVYSDDEKGTKRFRGELAELDTRVERKEGEMATIAAEAQERLLRGRLEIQPTQMVEVPEPPRPTPEPQIPAPDPGPPTPVPVPEPSPTPVPEPYPPPDEATPPEPARIPEPGPLGHKRKKK